MTSPILSTTGPVGRSEERSLINPLANNTLNILLTKIKNDIEFGSWIPHRNKFINALIELKNMIGNESTKNNIAKQVMSLIRKGKNNFMLNTCLYGPPGVGKTKLAIILAKIWISMGFLEKNNDEKSDEDVEAKGERLTGNPTVDFMLDNDYIGPLTVAVIIMIFIYKPLFNLGGYYLVIGAGLVILAIVFYLTNRQKRTIQRRNKTTNLREEKRKESDEDVIKVVSRTDFVDRWMGWTGQKTTELLRKNHGKVLFVDEAYSLINGEMDSYGREALDVLNRYLSENPRKIIVIFAGYRDKLQNSVFRQQPGLARRFMWQFDCPGYNVDELFRIFETQIRKENMSIKERGAMRRLFRDIKQFPNQAGDTERLVNYCQMEHDSLGKDNNVIDVEDLVAGLQQLEENNRMVKTDRSERSMLLPEHLLQMMSAT